MAQPEAEQDERLVRAELARRALAHRAAQRAAQAVAHPAAELVGEAIAETVTGPAVELVAPPVAEGADPGPTREEAAAALRAALDQRIAARGREHATELEEARTAAQALVAAARRDAAALLAAAAAESAELLGAHRPRLGPVVHTGWVAHSAGPALVGPPNGWAIHTSDLAPTTSVPITSPVSAVPPGAAPARERTRAGIWAGVAHPDVVLPLVAVVLVLLVLFAWLA